MLKKAVGMSRQRDMDMDEDAAEDKQKRAFSFNKEWLSDKEFSDPLVEKLFQKSTWLVFDEKLEGMFCVACREAFAKSSKTLKTKQWSLTPCLTLRRTAVSQHADSSLHRDALEILSQRVSMKKAKLAASDINTETLIRNLRSVYWLVQEEIAQLKFESLHQLMTLQGVSMKFSGSKTVSQAIEALSIVIEENLILDLKSSPFVALLTDETTDTANLKQLIFYLRYLVGGRPVTSFFGIHDIPDGTAETITDEARQLLTDLGISSSSLVGFGSDGAAVMTGSKSGVAARLSSSSPFLISIHCLAHRLALAAKDACDSNQYLHKQFQSAIHSIYQYYANSPVRAAGLKELQLLIDDDEFTLKEPKFTRWLSHGQAVAALHRSLGSVLSHLSQQPKSDALAKGLLKQLATRKFILTLLLFCDVMPILTKLSLLFQERNVDLSMIDFGVRSAITRINSFAETPGKHLSTADAYIDDLGKKYGVPIVTRTDTDSQFQTVKGQYIAALRDNLNARFESTPLLKAFAKLFDPRCYPSSWDQCKVHGTDELKTLCDWFGKEKRCGDEETKIMSPAMVDASKLETEWPDFREWFWSQFVKDQRKVPSMQEALFSVLQNDTLRSFNRNVCKLAEIALVLPVATPECERGFSTMKRIKTPLRNRLTNATLGQLMMVSIHGSSIEDFDFKKAASIFISMAQRKVKFGTMAATPTPTQPPTVSVSSSSKRKPE
jgi:hypothetical protein